MWGQFLLNLITLTIKNIQDSDMHIRFTIVSECNIQFIILKYALHKEYI